jgi:nucleoside-diphosphate-sugar epimerase
MKILAIGATGFIGPFVLQQLQGQGHSVTVFHRGNSPAPQGTAQIIGDRNQLAAHRATFEREQFDAVIDFVLSSERQARQLMETMRGITGRVIALSSMDAYRAWGVYLGGEPGDLEPLPLTEDSALRTVPAYPPEVLKRLSQMVSWADEEYDKVPAERIVMTDAALPGTILRLPMIYGPGDYVHRFYPFLKRIDDGRPFILFADDMAALRTARGYVEDVAAAIVLAATADRSRGRIYNICEREAWSELEWARKIAAATGWRGEFVVLPRAKAPAHLQWPYNTAQHIVVSSDRIRNELGYSEITPADAAFERTIRWERANPLQAVPVPFNYEAEDAAINDLKASA